MNIRFIFEKRPYAFCQIKSILDCSKYLVDYGIHLNKTKYDLSIIHNALLTPEHLKEKSIIVERADSSCVCDVNLRKIITNDNILGVIKSTVVNPPLLMNCGNRYHYKLINPFIPSFLPNINENAINKIECLVPISIQPTFERLQMPIDFDKNRKYDVVYIASPSTETPALHRQKFLKQSFLLSNKNKIVSSKTIDRKLWIDLLKQTKICISPWGYGEMCYRDFDAIYCGCVLLKPNTDFIISNPNIYQKDKYYKACKHDASDLQNQVDEILQNWSKFHQMRQGARDLLINFWNLKERAREFASYLKRIYENHHLY